MSSSLPTTVWVRYFDATWVTSESAAKALRLENLGDFVIERRTATRSEIVEALTSRTYVVVDAHGAKNSASIAPNQHFTGGGIHASELGVHPGITLAIVGACSQGRHFNEWRRVFPNAVLVTSRRMVRDTIGCKLIAKILRAASIEPDRFSADIAAGVIDAYEREHPTIRGFSAEDPRF